MKEIKDASKKEKSSKYNQQELNLCMSGIKLPKCLK
jgi:hypothetical protein